MARPSAATLVRKPSLESARETRSRGSKTFLGERARDEIADLAVIVDDQDVRSALHAATI